MVIVKHRLTGEHFPTENREIDFFIYWLSDKSSPYDSFNNKLVCNSVHYLKLIHK